LRNLQQGGREQHLDLDEQRVADHRAALNEQRRYLNGPAFGRPVQRPAPRQL
jgi:hypothetical protein